MDKKWIKWVILGLIIGFLAGKLLAIITGFFLDTEKWAVLIAFMEPAAMITALLIVLGCYHKEKEKILE